MIFENKHKIIDIGFKSILESQDSFCLSEKQFTEAIWNVFSKYSDRNFLKEIRVDFDARYWEMYLTVSLLNGKWKIECPKPGPDVKMTLNNGKSIWIEAIAPSGGAGKNPDKVNPIKPGQIQGIPDESITLRLTSAIDEKFNTKYKRYLEKGIILINEPYIIAINASKMDSSYIEFPIPRIVTSVLPFGYPALSRDPSNPENFIHSITYRNSITKTNGVEIPTDIFLRKEFEGLSGVLYSNVCFGRRPTNMGHDYIFVHNPNAKNPCPIGLFGFGVEYSVKIDEDKIELFKQDFNKIS